MELPRIDPEREEEALRLIAGIERQLGDERFGGAWIDRTTSLHPFIGIAVVDPSQRDVDAISRAAAEAGWPVQILAVRYSRARLVGMLEAREGAPPAGKAWVMLGWDVRINRIVAVLRAWDEQAISWARDRFPEDALSILISPGAGWASTLNGGPDHEAEG